MRFFRERLADRHDLSGFRCGEPALDEWLREAASTADRAGTGRTFVWANEEDAVVAYFTLAPHVVRRADVPARTGRGGPDAIPAILLARLALVESLHGRGLGGALLADAVAAALEGIRGVGGRLIVVDAIGPSAATFYEHLGFRPVPGNAQRLVMKASDAARALGLRWP